MEVVVALKPPRKPFDGEETTLQVIGSPEFGSTTVSKLFIEVAGASWQTASDCGEPPENDRTALQPNAHPKGSVNTFAVPSVPFQLALFNIAVRKLAGDCATVLQLYRALSLSGVTTRL